MRKRGALVKKRSALVSLLVAANVLLPSLAAVAADEDGMWWYEAMGVAEAVDAGADGSGVTIAVIDGQINPNLPVFDGADVQVHEPSFCAAAEGSDEMAPATTTEVGFMSLHMVNIVSLIVGSGKGSDGALGVAGVAPEATVRVYADTLASNPGPIQSGIFCPMRESSAAAIDALAVAIVQAVDDGVDIISVSQSVLIRPEILDAIAWAQHEGVVIVSSSSNEIIREGDSGTAMRVGGVVLVGGTGPDLEPAMEASVVETPTVMAPGAEMLGLGNSSWDETTSIAGNSLATPIVAGVLADVWSKYPDATANQMIQSLIRNTGSQDHELSQDELYGYGLVGLRHMLAKDPTEYPDVNPLLTDNGNSDVPWDDLTTADVAEASRPDWASPLSGQESTPTTTVVSGEIESDRNGSLPMWVWGIAVALALTVLVGVLVTIFLVVRKSNSAARNTMYRP